MSPQMLLRAISIVASGLLAMSASPQLRADDWESYQHDPQATGYSASNLDPHTLSLTWTSPAAFEQPLIVGNSVLAVNPSLNTHIPSVIDSFNVSNGSVNWSTNLDSGITVSPQFGYGGGDVVVGGDVENNAIEMGKLSVLNAATGALLYTVVVPESDPVVTVARDTTTNQQVAYVSDGRGDMTAVRLGATSGTTLWTASHILAGEKAPTIAGNFVLTANVDQFYAIDRTTGAVNHFYAGNDDGANDYTPVVDTRRSQFYILGERDSGSTLVNTLTAYSYSGGTITQLWTRTGAGLGFEATPALDANGNIYVQDASTLMELDPTNGNVLHSASGTFQQGVAPIVTSQYIYEFGGTVTNPSQAYAFNASDLSFATTIPINPPNGAGYAGAAIDDTHFIEAFTQSSGNPGFEVFTGVPEPTSLALLSIAGFGLLTRRRTR